MDWRDAAACRDLDPETFFPIGVDVRAVEEALSVCRECSVSSICLEWALQNDVLFGVWGGMTEAERETLSRRSRQLAARTA